MFQKTSLIIISIAGLFINLEYSFNCTCSYDYEAAYQNYDAVFRAKVLSVSNSQTNNYSKEANLEIIKIYKGKPKKVIMSEVGGCSTPLLIQNKEWVFFTSEENGIQVLGSCNPSLKLYPNKFIVKNSEKVKKWQTRIDKNLKLLDSLSSY